jgi:hypothetical protein
LVDVAGLWIANCKVSSYCRKSQAVAVLDLDGPDELAEEPERYAAE